MSTEEQVIVWDLENKHKWSFSYDRSDFYEEQTRAFLDNATPTKVVSIVDVILFNESWELLIQKRAMHKNHNPWLLDKTVWGHIKYWDPIDYTVMVETVEELQAPSLVVKDDENFEQRLWLLKNYVKTIAVLSHIDTDTVLMEKEMKEWTIVIANKIYVYFGVYWWRVKNVDKEAMWILYYDFNDLLREIQDHSALFTYDLKYMLKTYEKDIRSFISLIKKIVV